MFHRFLVFFEASRKLAFRFPVITLITIFAPITLFLLIYNLCNGATSLIFRLGNKFPMV